MAAPKRIALLCLSMLLLVACGVETSKRPAGAASPSSSDAAMSPIPNGAAPTSACRLPIGDLGGSGKGGFLSLPDLTFTVDPKAQRSYDWVFSKWLPVPHEWISPDGRQYAYPEYPNTFGPAPGIMHIVNVTTGADRALRLPAPATPISFEKEGLYIGRVPLQSEGVPLDVSLLDPASGSLRPIAAEGTFTLIAPDVAWGVDTDKSVAPPKGGGLITGNRLRQLHLGDGTSVTALTLPGESIELLGLDGRGAPVVSITDGSKYRVASFSAFAGLEEWFSGRVADHNPTGPIVSVASETWLSSGTNVIWKKSAGSPLTELATLPLEHPAVGGSCN